MVKAGTLTFHTACNFGAVLQAYALVTKLRENGVDAELIDYRAPFNSSRFNPKPYRKYLSLRGIYSFFVGNAHQKYHPELFQSFINRFIPRSDESATTAAELREIAGKYDVLISGSDQVWNLACTEDDTSYFLPFPKRRNQIKASYAASLGKSKMLENERAIVRPLIDDFDFISVRERSGKNLLAEMGKTEVTTVIDPTLLLDSGEWTKVADYSRVPDCPYLLIYLMSEDMKILKFAKRYAKAHRLKIVYITQRFFNRIHPAEYIKDASPEQWVGLFLNADTIVTNSFHGTAFGVNFNKNLFVKPIPHSPSNGRILDFMNSLGLDNRCLADKDCGKTEFGSIDYQTVDKLLTEMREISDQFLTRVISQNNA